MKGSSYVDLTSEHRRRSDRPLPDTPEDTPTLDVHALNADASTLTRKFDGMVSEETIERIVYESYTTLHPPERARATRCARRSLRR